MLHGSRALLCSSTRELLCPGDAIMCSTCTLLRDVISQLQMIKESKAGDIRPGLFFMRGFIFDPASGVASAHRLHCVYHSVKNHSVTRKHTSRIDFFSGKHNFGCLRCRQVKDKCLIHRIAMQSFQNTIDTE